MPFFNTTEASKVYKSAAEILDCWNSLTDKVDRECLRSKTTQEIHDATMSLKAIFQNMVWDILDANKITQFGEPYGHGAQNKIRHT